MPVTREEYIARLLYENDQMEYIEACEKWELFKQNILEAEDEL